MIKEEDFKSLDNDGLDILDFALDHEEEEASDEDEDLWGPSRKKPVDVIKKIEKPRECDKVKL
jgi:hypothetical protein